jgi:hypothetical protein
MLIREENVEWGKQKTAYFKDKVKINFFPALIVLRQRFLVPLEMLVRG